jgi:hypothetical protein
VGSAQLQSESGQPQLQGSLPVGPSGMMTAGGVVGGAVSQTCRFRVSHSSGETICIDLETAKALQRQKPGAKIFLERNG